MSQSERARQFRREILLTIPLLGVAVGAAWISWGVLLELEPWPLVVSIGLLLGATLALRFAVRRVPRPGVAALCVVGFALSAGGLLAALVAGLAALGLDPRQASVGATVPVLILVIACAGLLLRLLQPLARWWTAVFLVAAAGFALASDASGAGGEPIFPFPWWNELPGDPSRVEAPESPMEAFVSRVGPALLVLHVAVVYPLELATELRRLLSGRRKHEGPWEAPMALVFSLAWHWISLVLAAISGRGTPDPPEFGTNHPYDD